MAEPNKPQLPPESHYDPKRLDKIFAISAIVLLVALMAIFAKDYSRAWKPYQRAFKELELEKTRIKVNAESNLLEKNDEYQAILKELKEAESKLKSQDAQVKAAKVKINAADAALRLDVQQYQFAKAEYDALKYQYEAAAAHHHANAGQLKTKLDNLAKKIETLRLKVEADEAQVKDSNDALKGIESAFKIVDKKRFSIAKRLEILERKLSRTDPERMSVANQIGDYVRDWPILELANPNYKIRQIVLKDIPEDVNFMKVQRVDRCTTCHLGIDNPDFKNAAQPYRTHPNLELFIDKNSPHPIGEFGCTSCHQGRGRGTDFTSVAHSPRDPAQQKIWEKKYNWQALAHWEQPMFPAQHTQAGCFKCHEGQEVIKGAEKLNLGLNLIERAGCYGCHDIEKYKSWPKSGPNLEFLSSKTTKEWAYHWIIDPKSIRHNTWMPSYFNQSNNSDPASVHRSQQEVLSMVAFLFENSKPFTATSISAQGDPVKGKELVASVGCMGCHEVNPDKKDVKRDRNQLHKEFGPNLIGLGSKTDEEWLKDWLKDPSRYHSTTKMPDMRLSDQEAADIAAYLSKDTSAQLAKPIPGVNDAILNSIVFDFLKKSNSMEQAKAQVNGMDQKAKMLYAGKLLVREYGCFSCHNIPGFENDKPIGVELTHEGTKNIHRLDFGFLHIEHTKQGWFKQKLLDPRIFDKGRVLQPLERIKMPNFDFTEAEADAITTALLGFVKDRPNSNKMANKGQGAQFINEGRALVRQLNCQGCHSMEGDGGVIQDAVTDWLITYKGKDKTEALNMTGAFSPPNLLGEGAKVQAQWLFDFLHNPSAIRPWVEVRMPSYNYLSGQANTLVKYFNYLDGQEFPFTDMYHPNLSKEEFEASEKMFSKEVFGCTLCHVVDGQLPSGTQDSWGPDLGLSKRLKPDWIVQWLTNPPAMLPGTKMPVFFDPANFESSGPPDILDGDEHKQIRALRDYLLTISNDPGQYKKEAVKPVAPSTDGQ